MEQGENRYIKEITQLVGIYGSAPIEKLLEVSDRAIKYWIDGEKVPRADTRLKISELFETHKSGQDLRKLNLEAKNDFKDKYLSLLEEENARIKKRQAESLEEMKKLLLMNHAILKTLRKAVAQLISKSEKSDLPEVARRLDKETAEFFHQITEKDNLLFDK